MPTPRTLAQLSALTEFSRIDAQELLLALLGSQNSTSSLPYGADYVAYTYSGSFPATAVYKTGGSGGVVVKTLTYANDGTNITSITAS